MRIIPTGEKTRLLVEATALRDGNAWLPVSGRATLTVDGQLLAVHAGDRLRIVGRLAKAAFAKNPGAFDQAAYLRADRQLCRLWASHPACVSVVEPAGLRGVRWWIESVRSGARETPLAESFPGSGGVGLGRVLLGARAEIDSERTNVFVETGTVHLLAISGLHVGIVAGVLLAALRFFPLSRTAEFWIVLGWAVAYTLLTDAPSAGGSGHDPWWPCSVWAKLKCRPALPWNSLAAAGLIVLILNPADSVCDGGSSVVPGGGRADVRSTPVVCGDGQRRSARPTHRAVSRSVGASFSLGIDEGHTTFRCFGSGLAGDFAAGGEPLPRGGFGGRAAEYGCVDPHGDRSGDGVFDDPGLRGCCRWLFPLFGRVCDVSLGSLQAMIEAGHRLPGNPVFVAGLPDWWLLGFYGLLGLGVWATWRKDSRCWYGWGCLAVWLLVGTVAAHRFPPKDELVCTIVYVGHGSAAILEMPGGPVMVCDAGRMGSPVGGARDIASCLWSRKIGTFDAIAISHADADHFNAVPELMRRFSVKAMLAPPGVLEAERGSIRFLRDAIDERQIPVRDLVAGDRLRGGRGGD